MKRYYKIFLTFILSFACFTPLFLHKVDATGIVFTEPYEEPSTSESQGYINVLLQNKDSGGYFTMTWIWNITNESGYGPGGMKIEITDSSLKMTAQLPTNQKGYSFIYRYSGDGSNIYVSQYQYFTTSCEPYTYNTTSYKIIAYQAKGNVKHIIDETTSDKTFSVAWGNDSNMNKKMNELITAINNSNDLDDDILKEIKNINGDIDTVNSNLESIIERLRIANNHFIDIKGWLSDIWDSIMEVNFNITEYIGTRLDAIKNMIIGDVEDDGHIVESETQKDQLNNKIDDVDDIESGIVDDLKINLQNITVDSELLTQSDFVKTGVFLSTQMTNVYNANPIVRMMLTFGMIIGLAFTIIGISLKR